MTDVVGNPEEERRAAFYHEPWSQEAVSRYFYCKVRDWHLSVLYTPVALPLDVQVMYSCVFFLFLFLQQIQQRRQELEQALAVRNT